MNEVHLLHIEDDEDFHAVVTKVLANKAGQRSFVIVRAESEEAALEAFGQRRPDLVLVDYQLEAGDGLSCIQRVRQLDESVPLVALSGQATADVATELLLAGADEFLDKREMRPDRLRAAVETALRLGEVRRNLRDLTTQARSTRLETLLEGLLNEYLALIGPEMLDVLQSVESTLLDAGTTPGSFRRLWQHCLKERTESAEQRAQQELLARPLYLELRRRLEAAQADRRGT